MEEGRKGEKSGRKERIGKDLAVRNMWKGRM
jgi:hypothetical protein